MGGEGGGQISNRYISETAKDNPINMVFKSVRLRLENPIN